MLPSLRIAAKNISRMNKSLLTLKAIFGSSVVRFLRSKVLFVWFAEIKITFFTRLSKACKILDDADCWISADPISSVVEFSKSWSATVRMLFSTCVNTKKLLEISIEMCYQKKKKKETIRKKEKEKNCFRVSEKVRNTAIWLIPLGVTHLLHMPNHPKH